MHSTFSKEELFELLKRMIHQTEQRTGGQRVECAKLRRPEGPEAGILGSEIFLRVERAVGRVGAEAREAG